MDRVSFTLTSFLKLVYLNEMDTWKVYIYEKDISYWYHWIYVKYTLTLKYIKNNIPTQPWFRPKKKKVKKDRSRFNFRTKMQA